MLKLMILFPHMLVGAAIGAKIHSGVWIFILAIIAHFLADTLPHWDYISGRLENIKGKKFIIFLTKSFIDLFFGAIIIWYFFNPSPYLPFIFFGALVSVLPDGLTLLNRLTGQRFAILRQIYAFHEKIHQPVKKTSFAFNFIFQGIFSLFIIAVLFFLR